MSTKFINASQKLSEWVNFIFQIDWEFQNWRALNIREEEKWDRNLSYHYIHDNSVYFGSLMGYVSSLALHVNAIIIEMIMSYVLHKLQTTLYYLGIRKSTVFWSRVNFILVILVMVREVSTNNVHLFNHFRWSTVDSKHHTTQVDIQSILGFEILFLYQSLILTINIINNLDIDNKFQLLK